MNAIERVLRRLGFVLVVLESPGWWVCGGTILLVSEDGCRTLSGPRMGARVQRGGGCTSERWASHVASEAKRSLKYAGG